MVSAATLFIFLAEKSFNKHGVCACYGVAPPKMEVYARVVYTFLKVYYNSLKGDLRFENSPKLEISARILYYMFKCTSYIYQLGYLPS